MIKKKMKVFIGWSGKISKKIASILRSWIPKVIQVVQIFMSEEDIEKGARWSSEISAQLERSSFGIICITKVNLDSKWINFEAGALSKSIDSSRVCPVLYKLRKTEVSGPLTQFQFSTLEKEDMKKLITIINKFGEKEDKLDEELVLKSFEKWWDDFEDELEKLNQISKSKKESETIENRDEYIQTMLEEILEKTRLINRNIDDLLKAKKSYSLDLFSTKDLLSEDLTHLSDLKIDTPIDYHKILDSNIEASLSDQENLFVGKLIGDKSLKNINKAEETKNEEE